MTLALNFQKNINFFYELRGQYFSTTPSAEYRVGPKLLDANNL